MPGINNIPQAGSRTVDVVQVDHAIASETRGAANTIQPALAWTSAIACACNGAVGCVGAIAAVSSVKSIASPAAGEDVATSPTSPTSPGCG